MEATQSKSIWTTCLSSQFRRSEERERAVDRSDFRADYTNRMECDSRLGTKHFKITPIHVVLYLQGVTSRNCAIELSKDRAF